MRHISQQQQSDEALASHCRAESEFPDGDKVRAEFMDEHARNYDDLGRIIEELKDDG
jgi:hypothetical protein